MCEGHKQEERTVLVVVDEVLGIVDHLRRKACQVNRLLDDRRVAVQEAVVTQRMGHVSLQNTTLQ